MSCKYKSYYLILFLATALVLVPSSCLLVREKIGVIYVIHGGMDTNEPQYLWNASVHMFSYDPNHPVYKFAIWNPSLWSSVLDPNFTDFAARFMRMYGFEYQLIGGTDPFHSISDEQLEEMKAELDKKGWIFGLEFEVDWAGYMAGANVDHYAYPRFIYYGPDGPDEGYNCTYCGEYEENGPWEGCEPDRYNVDGPVERLLNRGVSRIVMIDLTVSVPRFSKSYDVVQMTKRALDDWNDEHGKSIPLLWVNDCTNLMERSYPTEPEGWTYSLGLPEEDVEVPLEGSPNPIAEDREIAQLHVEGIEASMSDSVSDADTGVMVLNHALHNNNEVFDPKIDDTLVINENIKSLLLERHPTMDAQNIIGAFMGIQEVNPENGLEERNRGNRGQSLGHAWLYESNKELPGDEWGYRYWDGLEYLIKDRGVKHIVIGFTQICTDSVLNLVELYNEIGVEIGVKNWVKYGTWDYDTYPGVGHPFADYWGIWVNTDCGEWDLSFDNGTSEFTEGATLTGQTSGATGVIKWFTKDSGDWAAGTAAGTLTLKEVSGTFLDNEIIEDSTNPAGSAFADGSTSMTVKTECCFEMGGCEDPLRPYPPPRQTPLNQKISDLDPHLAFDLSDYGHLGYDPTLGPPDTNGPVQEQYTGTWEMYRPPNHDPRVGKLLAKHVLNAALGKYE